MIDYSYFQNICPLVEMEGECEDETLELVKMYTEAKNFIASHKWCPEIKEEYFGGGIANVVAVFLFRFSSLIKQSDEWLWVIVGDLPSAYLVVDCASTPSHALSVYCEIMESWADCIISGGDISNEYPVRTTPSEENARALQNRIQILRRDIIPWLSMPRDKTKRSYR